MILKGPDVRSRTLVVPHSFAGLTISTIRTGNGGAPAAAASVAAPDPEAELASARAEAGRLLARATADAERLRAQAQVELGRATAEAEQLTAQARARLEEAGETITTLAEARQILAEHQAEATQLVAEAEANRQLIFDTARAEGHEAGRAAGYAEGTEHARAELREQLEHAFGVAAKAAVDRQALIAAAEPEIVRLAMDVARKLIARQVEADPDVLKGLVTRAMLKAAGDGAVRLRLNPQTIDRLGEYLADVVARFASRGVELVPDFTVEPAGAIVDTRTGSVDARLTTQLDKVERSLLALTGESA
ncbi:MAG TPA: FliH/SctL family protein [Chloroflexota bacterium]|nr:FliH/SctL family protein [Chloroflexota bacterium]